MKRFGKFALMAFVIALLPVISGCGTTYSLDTGATLNTSWGEQIQYKIDQHWTKDDVLTYSSDDMENVSYVTDKDKYDPILTIDQTKVTNVTAGYSTSTYAGWENDFREIYTKSQEEQLSSYLEGGLATDEKRNVLDYWPIYSNFSLEQTGSMDIDGITFRAYELSCDYEYSDYRMGLSADWYEEQGMNKPESQRGTIKHYYAILKDSSHNLEIRTKDKDLLEQVASTMELSWA